MKASFIVSIFISGITGYAPAAKAAESATRPDKDLRVIVTVDQAPIMQGKERIATAKKGDVFSATSVNGDWYGVLPSHGWIHKSNVQIQSATTAIPAIISNPSSQPSPVFRKYRGTFLNIDISKGQNALLKAGDTDYLLRIVPSNITVQEDPKLLSLLESDFTLAKVAFHSRGMEAARAGDNEMLQTALAKYRAIASLIGNKANRVETARMATVCTKIGLESGKEYAMEGILAMDADGKRQCLIVKNIDDRMVCTEADVLAQRTENPDFADWSAFPPTAKVNRRVIVKEDKKTTESECSYSIVEVTPERIAVQESHSDKSNKTDSKTRSIPHWIVAPVLPQPSTIDTGNQSLSIANKQMDTKWIKTKTTWEDYAGNTRQTEETRWLSNQIPGRIAKRVSTITWEDKGKPRKEETTEEVISWTQ